MKVRMISCGFFLFFIILTILTASAQTAPAAESSTQKDASSIPTIPAAERIPWVLVVVTVALGLLVTFPIMYDIKKTYAFEKDKLDKYFPVQCGQISSQNLELCKAYTVSLEGTKGLARTLMALTIIVILGTFLLYAVLTYGISQDSITNIASILAGAVSTIVGFYFGTRASEEAVKAGEKESTIEVPLNMPPSIEEIAPESGTAGAAGTTATVTIKGASFGLKDDKNSQITFGGQPVPAEKVTSWKDTEIKFEAPLDKTKGAYPIQVIVNGKSSIKKDFEIT